jgi:hypothetical protein
MKTEKVSNVDFNIKRGSIFEDNNGAHAKRKMKTEKVSNVDFNIKRGSIFEDNRGWTKSAPRFPATLVAGNVELTGCALFAQSVWNALLAFLSMSASCPKWAIIKF